MTFLIQISIGVYVNGLPVGFGIANKSLTINDDTPTAEIDRILNQETRSTVCEWIENEKSSLPQRKAMIIKPDAIAIVKL